MLPKALEDVLAGDLRKPADRVGMIVREVGRALAADRCFLVLRDPRVAQSQFVACWRRTPATPDVDDAAFGPWRAEASHDDDPMFVAARAGHPVTYVADVKNAGGLVNPEVERTYRHRALIHINLNDDPAGLWGGLQPAVSFSPRDWTAADRVLVTTVRSRLTALAARAIRQGPWNAPAIRLVG